LFENKETQMFKATVNKVKSLFDSQKGVVRADDAKLPTGLAAKPVAEIAVKKSTVQSFDLSALKRSGSNISASPFVVAVPPAPPAPPVTAAPAPEPTPAVIAAPIQQAEIPVAAVVATPVVTAENPTVKTETPVFTKAEIETIVRQYLAANPQLQTATPAPAAATAAEPTEKLEDGEIPGTRRALYVAPEPELIINPETGESITREEFNRREAEAMSRIQRERAGQRGRNQQAAITHTTPTGKSEWTRR
jgi:hypothetical protein